MYFHTIIRNYIYSAEPELSPNLLLCNYNTLGFIHVLACTPGMYIVQYYKNTVYILNFI